MMDTPGRASARLWWTAGEDRSDSSRALPSDTLALLQSESPFVITALEVLPVFFVRILWADAMRDRRTFVFIDNDGARHALLRSSSGSTSVSRVLHQILRTQAASPSFVWYCRVPSASNVADAPSRGMFGEMQQAGAERDAIPEELWAGAISGVGLTVAPVG